MSWDLRTNIKSSAGSQGTLLRGDQFELNQAKRWPRGYDPERQAEVREAVVGRLSQRDPLSDNNRFGPTRRDLIDTVARSTSPAEHFQDIQFAPGQRPWRYNSTIFDGRMSAPNVAGEYHPHGPNGDVPLDEYEDSGRTHSANPTAPTVLIQAGYERDVTPIHEIGHHVSTISDTEHSPFRTARQQGQEEAYADEYAQQHYRDRRGKSIEVEEYPGARSRGLDFHDAYHQARRTQHWAPVSSTAYKPPAPIQQTLPGVSGQMGGKPGDPWYGQWF